MNNTNTQPGNAIMVLVRMLRGGQVTLPAEARKALKLKEGDYLEAEIVAGEVRLKPVAVVDRNAAWNRVMAIVAEPKWRGPGPEPSDDELLDEVVEVIH